LNPAPTRRLDLAKIQAVVGTQRTDIASAIRLGARRRFPETGQKRLVLLSDGNENVGDAFSALAAAQTAGRDAGRGAVGGEPGQRRVGAEN
jgi:hypothetical protein